MDRIKSNVDKLLDGLKKKVTSLRGSDRVQGVDFKALGERVKRGASAIDMQRLRQSASQLKLPDLAVNADRLRAAKASLARQAGRARDVMPRSFEDVVPRAKEIAGRIADAVPKRAPVEPQGVEEDLRRDGPVEDLARSLEDRATGEPASDQVGDAQMRARARAAKTARPVARENRPLLLRALPLLLALVAGGIIHIVTTFAIPTIGTGSAWNRLSVLVPTANRMALLAPAAPGNLPLPFLAPDMRYAMCRYDLTLGPVQVDAVLPEPGWSLTLYTPQGDNYYAVPAQAQRRTELSFQIVAASDRLIQLAPGVRRADVNLSQVTSQTREGLVVLRAPIRGVAFQAEADRVLRAATCRQSRAN